MSLNSCPPSFKIVKLGNPDAERDAINAAFQAVTRCLGESAIPDQAGHAGEFLTTDGSVLSWGAGGGGGVVPTGTGFTHITAGVQDAAAKLVDTADVNNDQITYAKMQNVSATSRVLGRRSSGGGDVEELSIGQGVEISGTVLQAKLSTDGGNTIIMGSDNGLYVPPATAAITATSLTLPYASKRQVVTVVDASVTSLSKIVATLGTAPDTAVNADDDIDLLSLTTIPTAGSFDVRMNFLTPIGGTLPINYMVG